MIFIASAVSAVILAHCFFRDKFAFGHPRAANGRDLRHGEIIRQ